MNLLPYAIGWAPLAIVVIILVFYRQKLAAHEDDSLHVAGAYSAEITAQQVAVTKKLETVERWGKILTALALLYALALVGVFAYSAWKNTSSYGG